MQDGTNPKQLIVEKLKQSANILVTVSSSPSVDALAAALGLTLILNKLDKHATAVFSGVVPPAINFLEPGKTFENNVDSLRDFIIALDKEKADRLRYKVEDDVVRIFITPYRTKISDKDLQFSQGDFNVDLIVALGVEDQRDLDQAITAHGRILHDATVVTINAVDQQSSLGSIDWHDGNASSLSEMLATVAEPIKQGVLDQQISTALLTGIVAATERFSNQHTSPHVMTTAAQLMAAGANQQLIATKLQTIPAPVSPRREKPKQASDKIQPQPTDDSQPRGRDGEMHIQHNQPKVEATRPPKQQQQAKQKRQPSPVQQQRNNPEPKVESPQEEPQLSIAPPAAQAFNDLKEAITQDTPKKQVRRREMVEEPSAPGAHNINSPEEDSTQPQPKEESYVSTHPSWQGREIQPPTMGGTLSATAEQALEDKIRSEHEEKRNKTILTHGSPSAEPEQSVTPAPQLATQAEPAPQVSSQPPTPPVVELTPPAPEPAPAVEQPLAPEPPTPPAEPEPAPQPTPAPVPDIPVAPPPLVVSQPLTAPVDQPPTPEPALVQPAAQPTIEQLEREAAEHAAQSAAPQTLAELEGERTQMQPPVVSNPQAMPMQQSQPSMPGSLPPLPPMPDFSTLPSLPGGQPEMPQLPPQPLAPEPQLPIQPNPQQPPTPPDPAQFQIPSQ